MMPKHTQKHLDPRQPLVVDTTKLPRQPGATRALNRVVPAPADLGLELISVPTGSDLELDLSLTSVSEGVYVSGKVRGSLSGECGRCLNEISEEFGVEIAELFAYADSTTEETTDEDEVGRMQGDLLDLEPAVRDAVVLTLPTNPVCFSRTAQGCAPSAGCISTTFRLITATRKSIPAGPLCAICRKLRSRYRGRPQAQDVAQQHPVPPGELEGDRGLDRGLPPVQVAEAAAHRLLGLRHLQRPSGPRGLSTTQ
nr:hypothetical protein GCM10020092_017370 [Actinoplanes digitatis]